MYVLRDSDGEYYCGRRRRFNWSKRTNRIAVANKYENRSSAKWVMSRNPTLELVKIEDVSFVVYKITQSGRPAIVQNRMDPAEYKEYQSSRRKWRLLAYKNEKSAKKSLVRALTKYEVALKQEIKDIKKEGRKLLRDIKSK